MTPQVDSWCAAVDMGEFDQVFFESFHYAAVQSYVDHCKQFFSTPLVIMPEDEVRVLDERFLSEEICVGARVLIPKKKKEPKNRE
jgi:uroporphyrinogen-III decarboxylase